MERKPQMCAPPREVASVRPVLLAPGGRATLWERMLDCFVLEMRTLFHLPSISPFFKEERVSHNCTFICKAFHVHGVFLESPVRISAKRIQHLRFPLSLYFLTVSHFPLSPCGQWFCFPDILLHFPSTWAFFSSLPDHI